VPRCYCLLFCHHIFSGHHRRSPRSCALQDGAFIRQHPSHTRYPTMASPTRPRIIVPPKRSSSLFTPHSGHPVMVTTPPSTATAFEQGSKKHQGVFIHQQATSTVSLPCTGLSQSRPRSISTPKKTIRPCNSSPSKVSQPTPLLARREEEPEEEEEGGLYVSSIGDSFHYIPGGEPFTRYYPDLTLAMPCGDVKVEPEYPTAPSAVSVTRTKTKRKWSIWRLGM
jgi:hypothetical protein